MKKNFFLIILTAAISSSSFAQKFTKEISQEVPGAKGGVIRVVTTSRKLEIKSWNQPKVKVTAVIVYDTVSRTMTDEEWFEQMGIAVKPFSSRVDILSRNTGVSSVYIDGYAFSNGAGKVSGQAADLVAKLNTTSKTNTSRKPFVQTLTVMIPEGSNLDIDQKYGDVYIGTNVTDASIEINNGALDAQDIKNLKLKATYCNANMGNVENAEMEFYNGTLRAQQINDLDIDSRSSSIEYTKGNYAYLRSQSDNISIDELSKLDGRKSYGSIRIDKLNTSIELEGNNYDLKLRGISPSVEKVKIDNRYGDMRLPVRNLQNYTVNFQGKYSTVFAPFEKVAVKEDPAKDGKDAVKEGNEQVVVVTQGQQSVSGLYSTTYNNVNRKGVTYTSSSNTPAKFTSSVGDAKGKHTSFEIICQSCTVDFK